jgi:S1-C subfamily serine protease
VQFTAPVQSGNSGGPLLDEGGEVVGIVAAKLDALQVAQVTGTLPENVNFAIKGAIVRAFLDANRVDFSTAPASGKLDAAAVGERARKFVLALECWK